MKIRLFNIAVLSCALRLLSCTPPAVSNTPLPIPCPADVFCVDDDAPPGGDGRNWDTAFQTVQEAVDAAVAGQQVWVAEGTYKPAAARASVLVMKDSVSVYGGFAGTETSLAERPDPLRNSTLTGDFNGDDPEEIFGPGSELMSENSNHVVVPSSNITLDGFVIQNGAGAFGDALYIGGGIYIDGKINTLLQNLVIKNSFAADGGGIWISNSIVSISRTLVTHNSNGIEISRDMGGNTSVTISDSELSGNFRNAIYSMDSSLVIIDSLISSNLNGICIPSPQLYISEGEFHLQKSVVYGGGESDPQYCWNNYGIKIEGGLTTAATGPIEISDTRIFGHTYGPALYMDVVRDARLTNLTIDDNSGTVFIYGGANIVITNTGIMNNKSAGAALALDPNFSGISIVNLTISGNRGANCVIDVGYSPAPLEVVNSLFWDNTRADSSPSQIFCSGTGDVTYSCAEETLPGTGNVLLSADPFVQTASGELYLDPASPCADDGSNTAADDPTTGYPSAGLDWRNLTTRLDGTPDSGTVDMGRHYDPAAVVVLTYSVDAATATWTTRNADRCSLVDDQNAVVYDVPAGGLDSGSTSHGLSAGAKLMIVCTGTPHPAVATGTVP